MLALSYQNSTNFHFGDMDESGTINPAALNPSNATIAPNLLSQSTSRGVKRSRSPDSYGIPGQEAESDDTPSNKRSKSSIKQVDSPTQGMAYATAQPVQTPQIKTQTLPQTSPSQISTTRSTPGSGSRPATLKALPTVRDHTTDQLGPEGDEYIPREIDPDGETKVSKNGHPLDGRKYRCRTFTVPNRGEKLFMLATECARHLGYRDSYLLFNKNRSLYKIIASQNEKDNLIHQEILPYSYRSRQIAIVTARSMFRQFGSRLIENGRRVRDDYWEAKARKQGFTEEDAAGEKRPGAAKAREAAAAEASHAALTALPHGEIIYSNGPGMEGQPPGLVQVSLAPLPMIHLPGDDLRPNAYGNIIRPRQEIAGPPYQDRSQTSTASDILSQAGQAAEFNKSLSSTRTHRAKYLDDYWRRPHEQPTTQAGGENDPNTIAPQHLQSQNNPRMQPGRLPHEQMGNPNAQMLAQGYPAYTNPHNPMASPVQQMHRSMPQQMHHTPLPGQRHPSYGALPMNQMWQQGAPQPQPSPLSQSHHPSQYAAHHQQQSHMPPPQMAQQGGMGYGQMAQQMAANPAFAGMARGMYQNPQQFGMHQQGAGGQQQQQQQQQQPGMQGWNPATPGSAGGMQDWQRYQ